MEQQQVTRNVCKDCCRKFQNKSWVDNHDSNYQYICFICGRINEKYESADPPSMLFHIGKSHMYNKNFKMNDEERNMNAFQIIDNCRKRRASLVVDGGGIRSSRAADNTPKPYKIPKVSSPSNQKIDNGEICRSQRKLKINQQQTKEQPAMKKKKVESDSEIPTHSRAGKQSVATSSPMALDNDRSSNPTQSSVTDILLKTMKNQQQLLANMSERQKEFGSYMQNMGNEVMTMKQKEKDRQQRRLARSQGQQDPSHQQSMVQEQDFINLQQQQQPRPMMVQPIDQQQDINHYHQQPQPTAQQQQEFYPQPQAMDQQQEINELDEYFGQGLLGRVCASSINDMPDFPEIGGGKN